MKLLLTTILSTLVLFHCNESKALDQRISGDVGSCLTTHEVTIQNFKFIPAELEVNVGDCIHFTNMDSATHTVAPRESSEIQFTKSKRLRRNNEFTLQVEMIGVIDIFCDVHRRMPGLTVTSTQAPVEEPDTCHNVKIQDFQFTPAALDVTVGDCIRFTNLDPTLHIVAPTETSPVQFAKSRPLRSDDEFTLQVEKAGTIDIFCNLHPEMPGLTVTSIEIPIEEPEACHEVIIQGFRFSPDLLEVNVGDCIRFINLDPVPHTIAPRESSPIQFTKSEPLDTSHEFTLQVEEAGTIDIFCELHPRIRGGLTVVSTEAPAEESEASRKAETENLEFLPAA